MSEDDFTSVQETRHEMKACVRSDRSRAQRIGRRRETRISQDGQGRIIMVRLLHSAGPRLRQGCGALKGAVKLATVDRSDHTQFELCKSIGVMSFPTLQVYHNSAFATHPFPQHARIATILPLVTCEQAPFPKVADRPRSWECGRLAHARPLASIAFSCHSHHVFGDSILVDAVAVRLSHEESMRQHASRRGSVQQVEMTMSHDGGKLGSSQILEGRLRAMITEWARKDNVCHVDDTGVVQKHLARC
ncbi:uncharacterized protein B0H18DRAFT_66040 [Fomitopsis serialis]|uniref:uncharacterized protein n=1 Tax=Fomitopsis serialis TaxID=139415 RepID=UPI0020072931|nr:uncharacterized protein B0H18DRAFT_66040 [Neoantrodia serialis]KAH9916488.1 hypothetical protein B0H18DRAFT_66040 [Neoantrodia serialis]